MYKRGFPLTDLQITIRTLGGETEECALVVPKTPKFVTGEKVILLLSKNTGHRFSLNENEFIVEGYNRGKYSLGETQYLDPKTAIPFLVADLEKFMSS